MRSASLAIFFLDLELGEVLHWERLEPALGGTGVGMPAGQSRQSSTAGVAEQIVDIPACGGPQGFPSGQSTLQRTVEQFVDIPVPAGGGLHGIRLDPGGPSSSAVLRHERGHRDLRTFAHDVKSARSAGSSSARVRPHSSSWTLAAYEAEERADPDFEYQFIRLSFPLLCT